MRLFSQPVLSVSIAQYGADVNVFCVPILLVEAVIERTVCMTTVAQTTEDMRASGAVPASRERTGSTDDTLFAAAGHPPGGGVDVARVDPTTLALVQALFPTHLCGRSFLVAYLANAQCEDCLHPSVPAERRGEAAIVCVGGYRSLAKLLHFSYETTHMYVLVFRALGLLFDLKLGKSTSFIFPLGQYQPPTHLDEILANLLERYQSHRPKVRRLIENVSRRLGELTKEGGASISQPETGDAKATVEEALRDELLGRFTRVLYAWGAADVSGVLAHALVAESVQVAAAYAATIAQAAHSSVRAYLPRPYRFVGDDGAESRLCAAPGGRQDVRGRMNLPTGQEARALESERTMSMQAAGGNDTGMLGRPAKNLPALHHADDASQLDHMRADVQTPRQNLPAGVDSAAQPFNGNGRGERKEIDSTDISSVPVPVLDEQEQTRPLHAPAPGETARQRAVALALFIEGPDGLERNLGWYISQIRERQELEIRAAVIAFLQRKHFPQGKGALRAPGAFFNKRLKEVVEVGISEQVQAALQAFETLTFAEIDAALSLQAVEQLASRGRARATDRDLLAWRPKRGSLMSEAVAGELALRIPRDDPGVLVQGVRPIASAQGEAYVVDTLIGPLPYPFASVEDWEDYHAEMLDLDQKGDARSSGGK